MKMGKKWFVILILLGALIGITCFSEGEKGPVCYLKFDEGEGLIVKDSSGAGNGGKIMQEGKYTKWVAGKVGNALEFSGNVETRDENGCIGVDNMDKYDFAKGLTVEAWIKLNDKHKRGSTGEIISNTFADHGKGFRFRLAGSTIGLVSGEGGDGTVWGVNSNHAKNPVNNDIWYHVAGTYDGSVFKVYINGQEVGASKPDLALTKGRAVIYIGSYVGGYAYGFNGIIDEVKIYDYPRSALDILKDVILSY